MISERAPERRTRPPRARTITVRLTDEEDALVTAGAKRSGVSKSDYLRNTLRKAVIESFGQTGKMR